MAGSYFPTDSEYRSLFPPSAYMYVATQWIGQREGEGARETRTYRHMERETKRNRESGRETKIGKEREKHIEKERKITGNR